MANAWSWWGGYSCRAAAFLVHYPLRPLVFSRVWPRGRNSAVPIHELDIERDLLKQLQALKYTYRPDIRDRAALEQNFRTHFEALNRVTLTDREFSRLLEQIVTPDVFTAARTVRETNSFERDDGTPLHYTLVNIRDWCKNHFEVVNQLRMNTDQSHHRYDVLLLMNGVPMVQLELKTLAISPRRAMEQIVAYKNDPGNGYTRTILCFIQLFVISNHTQTWYFANNQNRHFSFNADERYLPLYQCASEDNQPITRLDLVVAQMFSKCRLSELISRYMVLVVSEQRLLLMRPYQIYAVKAIMACIEQNDGNGYIWHTTGSGKTLTSFKASTLLKDYPGIEKCLFVVDRKDLDRQTREEFNRFQPGCVEENTNTESLVRRLVSTDYADKVIVTTIQKLGLALDPSASNAYRQRLLPLQSKRIVFIFDECHRSQFGENHAAIRSFFPQAQLFGFTGTPIFHENASYRQIDGTAASYKTTDAIFQKALHTYTITNAIDDQNVLRFHIDYYKPEGTAVPPRGMGIAKRKVVEAILDKHDKATAHRKFNALLATASINDAIDYYDRFAQIQAARSTTDPTYQPLQIACVFSPPAQGNRDVQQLQEDLPQEKADNAIDPDHKKDALTRIVGDYNARYGTNYTLSTFDGYYQDVQKRIKDQQYPTRDVPRTAKVDIVIVVDMLLTGFDSKYLNTLYVDKPLKHHGLIQALSRTNRVLNDTKPYGNILDFRDQQAEVDRAIELFSGQQPRDPRTIWLVDPAPTVITELDTTVQELATFMQSQGVAFAPEDVARLRGDAARATFVKLFKEVQRLTTQLDQYTDLTDEQLATIEQVLPRDTLRAFRGVYLDVAQRLKDVQDRTDDPAVEQLDFEFVLFASAIIDYDYIMGLLSRYTQRRDDKQEMSRDQLIGLIQADATFLDERDDIAAYIRTLEIGTALSEAEIRAGYEAFKEQQHARVLTALAETHGLDPAAVDAFVQQILDRMIFDSDALSVLFAPLGLGWKARTKQELALMEDLIPVLRRLAHGRTIAGLEAYEQ